MKIALWLVVLLLAALWTGGAALTAFLVEWASGLLAAGGAADLGAAAAQAPLPAWLALWGIDPAWVHGLQEALFLTLQAARDALPWIGSALGLLVPVVWVLWAVGLLALLALAGGAHLLVGRLAARPAAAA
jgi:hypothetical protein